MSGPARTVSRAVKVVVSAGILIGGDACAQPATPSSGTRIRVQATTALSPRTAGTLVALDSDSLRFLSDRGESLVLPTRSVANLDRSLGKRSHVLEGLVTGLLAGMLIGSIAFVDPSEQGLEAIEYGIAGAAVGLFVGGAVGAAIQTERWETVPRESWRLGLGFDRSPGFRFAVGFQLD